MIKINLLKNDSARVDVETSHKSQDDLVRRQAFVRFIVLMLVPGALYFYKVNLKETKRSELLKVRNRISQVKEEIAKYGDVAEVVKQHEAEKAKLNSQLNLIKELSLARELSLRLLDTVQTLIPKAAWLRNFDYADNRLLLTGMAMDDQAVNDFVQSLEENIMFSNVILSSSKAETYSGMGVKRFEISCGLGAK